MLFSAAVTSAISIIECPCATLIEKLKISRIKACVVLFFVISLIAIPATLSFGNLENLKIFGKTIFDTLDFLTSNIMLPMSTLILCLISGWYIKIKGFTLLNNKILGLLFDIGLKYIVPIALVGLIFIGLK